MLDVIGGWGRNFTLDICRALGISSHAIIQPRCNSALENAKLCACETGLEYLRRTANWVGSMTGTAEIAALLFSFLFSFVLTLTLPNITVVFLPLPEIETRGVIGHLQAGDQ